MPVIKSFRSVPWSFNAAKKRTTFGFGVSNRFANYYVRLHRDPAIVKATEVIVRPDVAVPVPLAGDTGASKGQESQKNDATIERRTDLPAPVKVQAARAEEQEGKGSSEAHVEHVSVKKGQPEVLPKAAATPEEDQPQVAAEEEKSVAKSSSSSANSGKQKTTSFGRLSTYEKQKRRRLARREKDFLIQH